MEENSLVFILWEYICCFPETHPILCAGCGVWIKLKLLCLDSIIPKEVFYFLPFFCFNRVMRQTMSFLCTLKVFENVRKKFLVQSLTSIPRVYFNKKLIFQRHFHLFTFIRRIILVFFFFLFSFYPENGTFILPI